MALRVANWNVFHGTINNVTPQTRMTNFAAYCWALAPQADIIAFQEVPAAAITNMAAVVNGTGYQFLTIGSEYPPSPPPPASTTSDGYAVLYNPARVAPTGALAFFQRQNFQVGVSQGRPPVVTTFNRTGNPAASVRFADWHNETGVWAQSGITGLHNSFIQLGGYSVIAGDFNVQASALQNPVFPNWDSVYNSVDFILSNRTTTAVAPPNIGTFLSDVHYAIIADVNVPGF